METKEKENEEEEKKDPNKKHYSREEFLFGRCCLFYGKRSPSPSTVIVHRHRPLSFIIY